MAVSTVTIVAPPDGITFADPGLLQPSVIVRWTGGTGPFDVETQWDTDAGFASGNLITVTDLSVTSDHVHGPGADLGPAGTIWYTRSRVRDQNDAVWSSYTGTRTINFADAKTFRRYLYIHALVGVDFYPTDRTVAGPADDAFPSDGDVIDFRRYLYINALAGVGFDDIDQPVAGWDPNGAGGAPGDGSTRDRNRYLYINANIVADTPTPHIWYVYPNFGREGWELLIVGFGFGDTQGALSGTARLNALGISIVSWQLVAETDPTLIIDPGTNIATPVHQEVRGTVPTGAVTGLVYVETDGP